MPQDDLVSILLSVFRTQLSHALTVSGNRCRNFVLNLKPCSIWHTVIAVANFNLSHISWLGLSVDFKSFNIGSVPAEFH